MFIYRDWLLRLKSLSVAELRVLVYRASPKRLKTLRRWFCTEEDDSIEPLLCEHRQPCQVCRIIADRSWYLPDEIQAEINYRLYPRVYGHYNRATEKQRREPPEPARAMVAHDQAARAEIIAQRVAAGEALWHPFDLVNLPDGLTRLALHGRNGMRPEVAGKIGTHSQIVSEVPCQPKKAA